MKVTLVHNYYKQPGGEDRVVEAEADLLRAAGCEVEFYVVRSQDVGEGGLEVARRVLWSRQDYKGVQAAIDRFSPDIVHVHNIFPLISVAAVKAAKARAMPLVQTLHNYRPFCLNGVLYRDGRVCTDCLQGPPLSGIVHSCYRGSRVQSVAAALAGRSQVASGWLDDVDVFITSSEFARQINIRSGVPAEKIVVKPNPSFVEVAASIQNSIPSPPTFLFVGRLDERKGVRTIVEAAKAMPYTVRLVGDGDLRAALEQTVKEHGLSNVTFLGWRSKQQVAYEMASATALIVASEFYESFGNVIVEAYAQSLPVLSSDIGAQATLVRHGMTGLHFKTGNAEDLASKMRLIASNDDLLRTLRRQAAEEYQTLYTQQRNVEQLLGIYRRAIKHNEERQGKR
ncbi:glycosyltransferase family 4 protein [Deinococcus peraridilitoris]|uniref:Glycosyltransferase n=1 Tax=Deinococcus peraridilitoris (strain DSM 19664 / LMG 22246 / CIP 109416 / KR-200) TaxID=937777 RepID=L0A8M9_DEIPD|nr:glycosyltransferase family 4 protein [Deinococcus peraridilitoris]AFZ69517.1 glycosyltransferase [Deinococcus peraridilitoris DSM 19664]